MSANTKLHKRDINAVPGKIEVRIGYSKKNPQIDKGIGWMFHRKDYHDDGSITDTYGVELSRTDFLAAGGIELSEDPVLDTSPAALEKETLEKRKDNSNMTLEEYQELLSGNLGYHVRKTKENNSENLDVP